MNTLTKRDLYCNFKWLDKLKRFSDELITEDGTRVRIIILTRHNVFRTALQTSKTKFKKISAEHLNDTEEYKLSVCTRPQTTVEFQIDYQIMFINYTITAKDALKHVNFMIHEIAKAYYPFVREGNMKYEYNIIHRESLIDKLTQYLADSLYQHYRKSQDKRVTDE